MTSYVALIRGINVGGHKKIKMADLRDCCASLGLGEMSTYIQSGNVVFSSDDDREEVRQRLIRGIDDAFGFDVAVFLRTAAELQVIVDRDPFPRESADEPSKVGVLFLSAATTQAAVDEALSEYAGPEVVRAAGSELYIYFPDGMGRSKLNIAKLEKQLGVDATARNWNSVTKLLALVQR